MSVGEDQPEPGPREASPGSDEEVIVKGPRPDLARVALWTLPGLAIPPIVSVLLETTLVFDRDLPWISQKGVLGVVLAYVIGAPIALSLGHHWWHLPRTGTARLTSEGVYLSKHETNERFLPWAVVSGVSAARPHSLQLHVKGEWRADRFWTLPTPDEATRVRLMTWLDERGIKQL